jgi:hypothetical protein
VRCTTRSNPPLGDATIEQRVEAGIRRQALLAQDDGPLFHCIVDEGALHRPVGGRAVMRAQLARIIEAASLTKVTFQLIPLDVGAHPALDSTFVILEFDEPMLNDVVYVEGVAGNIYLESAGERKGVNRYSPKLHFVTSRPPGTRLPGPSGSRQLTNDAARSDIRQACDPPGYLGGPRP